MRGHLTEPLLLVKVVLEKERSKIKLINEILTKKNLGGSEAGAANLLYTEKRSFSLIFGQVRAATAHTFYMPCSAAV